jgi:leader peptidase (prepilin peptidase)/N-methyltransferase
MALDSFLGVGAGLLGLAIGSFLNVVIHRLPRMLQAQWQAASQDQGLSPTPANTPPAVYNLAVPGSHCPQCGHVLPWSEKIPVWSFLALRGRCRQCRAAIGWRYAGIELLTAALFVWIFGRYGLSSAAWAWAGFAAALLTLAAIDADTTLLPDAITQPLVWAGLLAAALGLSHVSLSTALWGAIGGYLFLWSVYWLFKCLTGKEGMGQGDFKLLAAMGAWLGWPALLSMVLVASVTGALVGIWLQWRQRLPENGMLPFGPFLALSGLWVMAFGALPLMPILPI